MGATVLESSEHSLEGRGWGAWTAAGVRSETGHRALWEARETLTQHQATSKAFGKMLRWPWQEAYWEEGVVIQARVYKGLNNREGSSCGKGKMNPRTVYSEQLAAFGVDGLRGRCQRALRS